MPQLDKLSFIPQLLWFFSIFFLVYIFLPQSGLPILDQNLKLHERVSIYGLSSGDDFVLKLSAVFIFCVLVAIVLSKLLLRTAWFLSVLKNLSQNLWIYFLAAFPFYFSRSVLFFVENPSWKCWEGLLVGGSSLFFLFLISVLYVGRGSDKLYDWLLFNTRIRVALANFVLLSLFIFNYFCEDITTLLPLVSVSLVATFDYLDGLVLPIFVVSILKIFLLIWSYFLFGYLYLVFWLSQVPFLVIVSHYLASGVLLRGISLYPSLLELFNWSLVAENSVETTKVMGRGTQITLITVPEILGKSAVRPKSFRPLWVARSFGTFSKYGVDTRVIEFFKKEPSLEELKKKLPFSLVEDIISKFPITTTSLYQKDFIARMILEEQKGKSREEAFGNLSWELELHKLSKDKLWKLYGLTAADLVNRNWHPLNGEDIASAEKSYKLSRDLLASGHSLQDISLLVEHTKPSSLYDMAVPLSGSWDQNFPQTRNYNNPASGRLFIFQTVLSKVAFGTVPTSFELSGQGQNFFDSDASMLAKCSESETIQKLQDYFRGLGNPVVEVLPVTEIHGGDVRLVLADSCEVQHEITKNVVPYARYVGDPTVENAQKVVSSVGSRLVEKHLVSDADVAIDLALVYQSGEDFRELLKTGNYLDVVVNDHLVETEKKIEKLKIYHSRLNSTESKDQVTKKIYRLEDARAELKRVRVDPVKNLGLDKAIILTSATFKK